MMPLAGRVKTSRMALITVITPTYRSPPWMESILLQAICTSELVNFIMKPTTPRLKMSLSRYG